MKKRQAWLVVGIAACAGLVAQADARLMGGPGLRGGLSHMGTAMSIHAPGGGEFRGGFNSLGHGGAGERQMGVRPGAGGGGERDAGMRPGQGGSGERQAGMRPGQGGSGERWPTPGPPGPNPPGPGPGPGPNPPGPGPGPHPPGPGPHPYYPVPYPYPVPVPGAWWDWDADPYWDYPIATAAVVGAVAGAAATSAALGTTVYSLPSNCETVFKNDLTYFQCGNVWYQPHYLGTGVTYVVISPP